MGLSVHVRMAAYSGSARTTDARFYAKNREQTVESFAGTAWKISHSRATVAHSAGGEDHFLSVTASSGTETPVAFALEFEVADWTREHFVVLPGAVYDGNRFNCRKAGYPPSAAVTGDVGPHAPTTINDIPRLPVAGSHGLIQLLSADCATPAIGFYDPHTQTGVWLLTGQNTRLGQTGIDVEEDFETGRAVLRFSAPGVRETNRYHCFRTDAPSVDEAPPWQENESAVLQVRAFVFPCEDRPKLLDRFLEIRTALAAPEQKRNLFPLSAARRLIEEKHNRDNWHEDAGLYCCDTLGNPSVVWSQPADDGSATDFTEKRDAVWQSGWVGGGMIEWPLLIQGSGISRDRALRSLSFLCTQAVSSSGFFRGLWRNGRWGDDSFGHSKSEKWHLTRKSADVLLFLAKQIQHAGSEAPPVWEIAVRGCVEAFLRGWREDHQIGQFVDEDTGALLVGGSDAAAILPAALCCASSALDEVKWIENAVGIGDYFWKRFHRQGFTTGGPGEILSAPDSESAFGLLESMVALYESTGDMQWLRRAESVAALCATWCVSYDYVFPRTSTFGALNISTRGTVIANAQNKHSSPGICTLSGDSLFRLFRATGKIVYLDLIREIATSLPQFVSREDRPITARYGGAIPSGWICERVNMSDWLEAVGEIFHGSCWCEVSLLLTALELPTVYFQTDTRLLAVLDHLEVRSVHHSSGRWTLEITNTTPYPATVRVLAETADEARRPLAPGAISRLKPFDIQPGETRVVPCGNPP